MDIFGGRGTNQTNDGTGNTNIGRDQINNFNLDRSPLHFNPSDLALVIEFFFVETEHLLPSNIETDFSSIPMKEKNKLNNLSDRYYEHMKDITLPYIDQIDNYLKDFKNKELRERYDETIIVLKGKILALIDQYPKFDLILEGFAESMDERCAQFPNVSRRLSRVFLYFMYFNCDIGLKV